MSDPIVNKVAQQAAEQSAQQGAAQPLPEADAMDQAKFDQAMNQGGGNPSQIQQPDAAQQSEQVNAVNETEGCETHQKTMGEAILDCVEKMKTSHDTHAEKIQEQLTNVDGEPMSVEDCMKVNFEVMQMSLEQDLTSKIATKTSDGVQTLFKNQ